MKNYSLSNQELNSLNYSLSRIYSLEMEELESLSENDDSDFKETLISLTNQIRNLYSKFTDGEIL